jgi:hypothetical protein
MFLLFLFFACDDPTIAPKFYADEISSYSKYKEIEVQIQHSLEEWYGGNAQQAREELMKIFAGPFQELQPLLAENDRVGLVQVELLFGETLQKMKSLRSKGRQELGSQLIETLRQETEHLEKKEPPTEEGPS